MPSSNSQIPYFHGSLSPDVFDALVRSLNDQEPRRAPFVVTCTSEVCRSHMRLAPQAAQNMAHTVQDALRKYKIKGKEGGDQFFMVREFELVGHPSSSSSSQHVYFLVMKPDIDEQGYWKKNRNTIYVVEINESSRTVLMIDTALAAMEKSLGSTNAAWKQDLERVKRILNRQT